MLKENLEEAYDNRAKNSNFSRKRVEILKKTLSKTIKRSVLDLVLIFYVYIEIRYEFTVVNVIVLTSLKEEGRRIIFSKDN